MVHSREWVEALKRVVWAFDELASLGETDDRYPCWNELAIQYYQWRATEEKARGHLPPLIIVRRHSSSARRLTKAGGV